MGHLQEPAAAGVAAPTSSSMAAAGRAGQLPQHGHPGLQRSRSGRMVR
jgi:hypothetical protein